MYNLLCTIYNHLQYFEEIHTFLLPKINISLRLLLWVNTRFLKKNQHSKVTLCLFITSVADPGNVMPIYNQCCGSWMFILDPGPKFFHPGSRVKKAPDPGSGREIEVLLTQITKLSEIWSGVKEATDPGPQHCLQLCRINNGEQGSGRRGATSWHDGGKNCFKQ